MCLAVPMKVRQIQKKDTAVVEFGTIERNVNIQLLDGVKPGDYLVVHAGVAIEKLDREEAERMLELLGTLETTPKTHHSHPKASPLKGEGTKRN